jgi:hypothetical protein
MDDTMKTERRWIILASDGRHVTIGRDIEPSEADLDHAVYGLRRLGFGGWLAVMDGDYYGKRNVILTPVRVLTETDVQFRNACELFRSHRHQANA